MSRTKTNPVRRAASIELTRYICRVVETASALRAAQLEREMGFSGGTYRVATPGQRWRRYSSGKCALMPAVADVVVRKSLLRGWWPLRDDGSPHWRVASAGVQKFIEAANAGKPLIPDDVMQDARTWRDQIERRKRSLQTRKRRLMSANESVFRAARTLSAGRERVELTECRELGDITDLPAEVYLPGPGERTVELLICVSYGSGVPTFNYARLPFSDTFKLTFRDGSQNSIESDF
ncbi:hypothetical protein [Ideonella paludis]|uniref:Uncharacterized protein n=2 Tax=Ideonella paludis TaxID=1233411 RepID=A0ABS5E2B7_9BURK|nr:hypothetical protein [Ideonella paludis]MBQ0937557.1 hypothetical protein [Ideonella paludis]